MQATSRRRTPELLLMDQKIGHRLRQRRTMLGMTQDDLAKQIGITFQQVQKYEKGTNRISGSRIIQLSRVLNVKINWFFDDIELPEPDDLPPDTAHMLALWGRLGDAGKRRNVIGIMEGMVPTA